MSKTFLSPIRQILFGRLFLLGSSTKFFFTKFEMSLFWVVIGSLRHARHRTEQEQKTQIIKRTVKQLLNCHFWSFQAVGLVLKWFFLSQLKYHEVSCHKETGIGFFTVISYYRDDIDYIIISSFSTLRLANGLLWMNIFIRTAVFSNTAYLISTCILI